MLRTCPGSFLGNMETKIGFIIVLAKKIKIFFEVFVKIVLHIYISLGKTGLINKGIHMLTIFETHLCLKCICR